jgi:putative flippase GtrA
VSSLTHFVAQYAKFSFVGALATGIHLLVFSATIELLHLEPMLANLVAFSVAFVVSFSGHRSWTFRTTGSPPALVQSGLRFGAVAAVGLALNSGAVFLTTEALALSYRWALIPMATVVPFATYLMNRYWAFR